MVEIDGIRLALALPVTEAGDYISDEYLKVIDLVTTPVLYQEDVDDLADAVMRLNRNRGTTSDYLGQAGLLGVYNDVVVQINELTSWKDEINLLHLVTVDDAASSSPYFI